MKHYDYPLTVRGKIVWDDTNLRVIYSHDLARYYRWFTEREFKFRMTGPAHSSHTTIVNAKIHKNVCKDLMKRWDGKEILVNYSPYIHVGAKSKDYRIFMLFCQSPYFDKISEELKVTKPYNWHITIANTKAGTRPYIF